MSTCLQASAARPLSGTPLRAPKSLAQRAAPAFLALALLLPCAAKAELCELPKPQVLELWNFDVVVDEHKVSWEAVESAADLLRRQVKYFNEKDSPFAKHGVKAQLGFYFPNVSLEIEPKRQIVKTLAGRDCQATVGMVLRIKHDGIISLPKELTQDSCVASWAMKYQIFQHKVVSDILDTVRAPQAKADFKARMFEQYRYKGSVAEPLVATSAKAQMIQDDNAKASLLAYINQKILMARYLKTQDKQSISALFSQCNGEFAETSERVK